MANNININQMLGMMGGNPQQFLQMQMQKNPQIAQTKMQLENMQKSSGLGGKEFALQYAKQNGIPEQVIMQLANGLGLK